MPSVSRGSSLWVRRWTPAREYGDQRDVAQRIDRKCRRGAEAATMPPPIAGPTLRAMLNPILFSATAPGSSARDTMSPTDACHAGALNAAPQPIRNVSDSNSHGVIRPVQAHIASSTEIESMKLCAASITLRRSRLSAIAPAISDNSIVGNVTDAWTSATMSADCAMEIIIHDAPTD